MPPPGDLPNPGDLPSPGDLPNPGDLLSPGDLPNPGDLLSPGDFLNPGDLPNPGIKPRCPALQASLVAQLVQTSPAMWETRVDPWIGKIWRRERLPTPVFWPGESHGLCSPRGHKKSDTTERPSLAFFQST